MRSYELIVMLNPDLDEGTAKSEIEKITMLLTSQQATNINVASQGRKEIAYRVEGQKFCWWYVVTFQSANSPLIATLKNTLSLADAVIKYFVTRTGEKTRRIKVNPKRKNASGSLVAEGAEGFEADF